MGQAARTSLLEHPIAFAPATPRKPAPSLHRMARSAIQLRLGVLLSNEAPMREVGGEEALHDMRVASRRLREALRVFGFLFSQKRVKPVRRDTRRITRALGLVREVDVNLQQLESFRPTVSDRHSVGLEFIMAVELERQVRLRKRMLKRLKKLDLSTLRDDVDRLLKHPLLESTEGSPGQGTPFAEFTAPRIEEGLRPVHEALARLSDHPTPHNYHRLRIGVKRLRYTVELLSRGMKGHHARRVLNNLKSLQDALGTLHDRVVLHARAREVRRALRARGLVHLERETLRFMLFLSHRIREPQRQAERMLHRLDDHQFFENLPLLLKEDR
ncbi:MAG: CHAD domain-containing protein [Acidobacteriia bacterium]|nr:CHAD domain-containing protein [Terriglobia bacterium]